MPQSLIEAGYADQVLAPADMPAALMSFIHHPYVEQSEPEASNTETTLAKERPRFNEILAILRTRTGRDFRGYKRPTLLRRMQRRMGLAQVTTLADYADILRRKPEEVVALSDDLTINVTGFFRDAEAWEVLRTHIVRPLFESREANTAVRAWVAGCSSGEEAYTLAMLLTEEAEALRKQFDIKIFATDTAEKALSTARAGLYPGGIEGDLEPARIERFFEKDEHSLRVKKSLREMVVFAPQNLLTDPPFSRLDLVTCRNLLIYLEPDTQRRIITLMHFALREGGTLFLGNSETVGGADELFVPVNKKWRIYRRVGAARHGSVEFPVSIGVPTLLSELSEPTNFVPRASLGLVIQRVLTERYGPPAVVVDRRGRIVYFHGATERYFVQPTGEPTRNLSDLVRDGLRAITRAALRQAMAENRSVTITNGQIRDAGGFRRVQVSAAPMADARLADHFLITFTEEPQQFREEYAAEEVTQPDDPSVTSALTDEHNELERELRTVREELQSTIEELESSNEELKASNEEVTSINEELQSTNEELETSKEELQSLNEELTTVNAQLQAKIEELESTTNDLTNLLSSTNIAVIFLDTALRVRRFTPAVRDLLELIPSDLGRPIEHLAQKFVGGNLVHDAQQVLDTLVPMETEIRSTSGRFYIRRILPYRTADNRIAGIVVTFFDISERKRAEDGVQAAQSRLQTIIEQMPAAVLVADAPSGRLVMGNRQASLLLGYPLTHGTGADDWTAVNSAFAAFHPNERPYLVQELPLFRSLTRGETVTEEPIRYMRPDGTRGTVAASSTPIRDPEGNVVAAVAMFWDITDRKRAESSLRESIECLKAVLEDATEYAVVTLSTEGRISNWNVGAERLFGRTRSQVEGKDWALLFGEEPRNPGPPAQRLRAALDAGCEIGDFPFTTAEGTPFRGYGMLLSLRNEMSAPKGYLLVARRQR
jgi:two-component system CheB/CheR fusion protein